MLLHAVAFLDGAGFVGYDIFIDGAIVNSENVGRLSCVCVDHGPYRATIAINFAFVSCDGEVTLGEITHSSLNPGLHVEVFKLFGHFLHFDGEPRQHPGAMDAEQVFHAEATTSGMEVCGVEQVVAKVS